MGGDQRDSAKLAPGCAFAQEIYEDRAVVFLDILGFKDHVDNNNEAVLVDALNLPYELPSYFPAGIDRNVHISALSDSIVISTKLVDINGKAIGGASLLVYMATFVQLKLLAKGLLSRGGATIGKLHHKNNILFGKAMSEACGLESQLAIYPRIVVSNQLRARYMSELETIVQYSRDKGNVLDEQAVEELIASAFWKADDGVHFIHYLGASGSSLPPEYVPDHSLAENRPYPAAYGLDGGLEFIFDVARRNLKYPENNHRATAKHDWFHSYLANSRDARERSQEK